MGKLLSVKNILLVLALLFTDLAVYVMLGLFLMNYDDFYDESKGPYWSLESMTGEQQATYIGLQVWHVVNFLFTAYVVYRLVGYYRSGRKRTA